MILLYFFSKGIKFIIHFFVEEQIENVGLQSRAEGKWKSCPRDTSKPMKCMPIGNEIYTEKSMDNNGEEKAAQFNKRLAFTFAQAVRGCKHDCVGMCKSFNIKKREFGRGYNCVFSKSVVDNQNCHGEPGAGDPITTYMKYSYGDCATEGGVNHNITESCCSEDMM